MSKPLKGMQPKVKDLWVKALRSGKYTQGTGVFAQVEESGSVCYCVFGVLAKELNFPEIDYGRYMGFKINGRNYDSAIWPISYLPAGITPATRSNLMTLNDSGSSFEELADLIEKKL